MVNALIPFTRLDRIFDDFWVPGHARTENGHSVRQLPRADVLEGDKEFQIRLDMPGVERSNLDINVEDQTLFIKGERKLETPDGFKSLRKELPGKQLFQRNFDLGQQVDAEHISARLEEGMLVLTLPKSEQALPRRIEVK